MIIITFIIIITKIEGGRRGPHQDRPPSSPPDRPPPGPPSPGPPSFKAAGPPSPGPPSPGPPSAGPPKISLFLFRLPLPFSFILPSLGGLLVEFWWCFRSAGTLRCALLGSWGCCVKPWRSRWASHNSPRTPNVHISESWCFKHHQNSTRRPQEREE